MLPNVFQHSIARIQTWFGTYKMLYKGNCCLVMYQARQEFRVTLSPHSRRLPHLFIALALASLIPTSLQCLTHKLIILVSSIYILLALF